ncbi:short-chain dehydrogenase/reductase (plasmid) [Deinococcus aetherius]|uniref:Short-chain dehydrogenase/reductase n=1 Tax=Deinococcus aetherius TaxID=200252 RepID=A0ABM8AHL2_9DEIO|nr:SDR family oxidoreductase [Deinococcus aetherius]BDP43289.1 short-chain dehydrogenase/reductase [Deinococcus aetherius]
MTFQTILITGAGSGFGRLTALELARRGHTVFAGIRDTTGRNAGASGELRDLAAAEGLALHVLDLDVQSDVSVENAVGEALGRAGRLDVVVNNAGLSAIGPIEAFSSAQAHLLFDTNVLGNLRVIRAALPTMRVQGSGLLIQISSVLGRVASQFTGLYAASKFALEGLTEALHHELAPFGIEAVALEPGAYPTDLLAKGVQPGSPAVTAYAAGLQQFGAAVGSAMQSAGEADPGDVAKAVARLIEMPAGTRPVRLVVAPGRQGQGPETVNTASERATAEFFSAMHLTAGELTSGQDPYTTPTATD